MKKTLIKHGNSLALVIDKPILEMLQITPDTQLEISTNRDQLLLTPCRPKGQQKKLGPQAGGQTLGVVLQANDRDRRRGQTTGTDNWVAKRGDRQLRNSHASNLFGPDSERKSGGEARGQTLGWTRMGSAGTDNWGEARGQTNGERPRGEPFRT